MAVDEKAETEAHTNWWVGRADKAHCCCCFNDSLDTWRARARLADEREALLAAMEQVLELIDLNLIGDDYYRRRINNPDGFAEWTRSISIYNAAKEKAGEK